MAGPETLGIISGSTQLAAYAIQIALHLGEICKGSQTILNRTREHQNQVRELLETTTLIEQHKGIQSPVIYAQLQRTLVEARSLHNLLRELVAKYSQNQFYRYWYAFKGIGEEEILARFSKLEREKSALRLCISVVHTDILVDIQAGMEHLSDTRRGKQSKASFDTMAESASYAANPNEPFHENERTNTEMDLSGASTQGEQARRTEGAPTATRSERNNLFQEYKHCFEDVTGGPKTNAGNLNSSGYVEQSTPSLGNYYKKVSAGPAGDKGALNAGDVNGEGAIQAFFGREKERS
ncbi:MAG: hypothetical protein Q9227_006113 [Pyrenula ochraceoflavens]